MFRKFYLSCIGDEESSEEEDDHVDEEEVIASHGVLAEQHEKPDDLLDNYFLLGEDDYEVCVLSTMVLALGLVICKGALGFFPDYP